MKEAVLPVEEFLYAFYEKVGQQAGGIPAEKSWRTPCSSWQVN